MNEPILNAGPGQPNETEDFSPPRVKTPSESDSRKAFLRAPPHFRWDDMSPIKQPELIPAMDAIWGDDQEEFWNELALKCKGSLEADHDPDILKLVARLGETMPGEVQPWLAPVEIPENTDLWIIGDLHGDLLSFHALTEFGRRKSQLSGRIAEWCFLGDLFDDGPYGGPVLEKVLNLVDQKLAWFVVGNHDLALSWNPDQNRFEADVTPHDFADWLNTLPPNSAWRVLAGAAIKWFETAPRALVLNDGTLIAHGGCVHADRIPLLAQPQGSLHPAVLEDLVWLRAHDTSRRKIPNRTARGCQFGFEDLFDFLNALSQAAPVKIQRVIRGHDHITDRWAAPTRYQGRLLTINAMSWKQRDPIGPFLRKPVVVRYKAGEPHEMFQIEIPEAQVSLLYDPQPEAPCDTSGK